MKVVNENYNNTEQQRVVQQYWVQWVWLQYRVQQLLEYVLV